MRAVIYCRVSTKEQAQNLSLPTQLRACRAYCEREGYKVAEAFTDAGESAKTIDRPEFKKLLEYCRLHKRDVQFVVFYNITRFSRSSHDFAIARTLLQRFGISIRSVNELLSDDPVGKLTGNILAAIGQFDNDEKARRTAAGMQAALELGRWPFRAPIGHLNGGQSGRGILIPDPDRAPLVKLAFEEFGTGHRPRPEVLRRVTALGLTTRSGKPLSAQSFAALLRNRLYAGWVDVPKWGVSARGDFEPLVPDALFRRAQRLLGGTGDVVRPYQRRHPDFPLRRFVACGHCATPLTGSWSTGRARKYAYYHCRKCRSVKVTKLDLESAFLTLLGRLQPASGYMRLFNEIVLDVWNARRAEAKKLRSKLEAVVRQKRDRLDRVEDAFLHERSIDRQTYERQRDKLREQLSLAEMDLSDAVLDDLDVEGVLGFAEHVMTNAARLWTELEIDGKQELQQAIFPEGVSFDGEEFGTAVTSLAFKHFEALRPTGPDLASPTGFEPVF